jgi:hypothetical protein
VLGASFVCFVGCEWCGVGFQLSLFRKTWRALISALLSPAFCSKKKSKREMQANAKLQALLSVIEEGETLYRSQVPTAASNVSHRHSSRQELPSRGSHRIPKKSRREDFRRDEVSSNEVLVSSLDEQVLAALASTPFQVFLAPIRSTSIRPPSPIRSANTSDTSSSRLRSHP